MCADTGTNVLHLDPLAEISGRSNLRKTLLQPTQILFFYCKHLTHNTDWGNIVRHLERTVGKPAGMYFHWHKRSTKSPVRSCWIRVHVAKCVHKQQSVTVKPWTGYQQASMEIRWRLKVLMQMSHLWRRCWEGWECFFGYRVSHFPLVHQHKHKASD